MGYRLYSGFGARAADACDGGVMSRPGGDFCCPPREWDWPMYPLMFGAPAWKRLVGYTVQKYVAQMYAMALPREGFESALEQRVWDLGAADERFYDAPLESGLVRRTKSAFANFKHWLALDKKYRVEPNRVRYGTDNRCGPVSGVTELIYWDDDRVAAMERITGTRVTSQERPRLLSSGVENGILYLLPQDVVDQMAAVSRPFRPINDHFDAYGPDAIVKPEWASAMGAIWNVLRSIPNATGRRMEFFMRTMLGGTQDAPDPTWMSQEAMLQRAREQLTLNTIGQVTYQRGWMRSFVELFEDKELESVTFTTPRPKRRVTMARPQRPRTGTQDQEERAGEEKTAVEKYAAPVAVAGGAAAAAYLLFLLKPF